MSTDPGDCNQDDSLGQVENPVLKRPVSRDQSERRESSHHDSGPQDQGEDGPRPWIGILGRYGSSWLYTIHPRLTCCGREVLSGGHFLPL